MFKYWPIKLAAIILAAIFWLVAMGLNSDIIEVRGVGIKVVNIDDNLSAALDTYEIDLKVNVKKSLTKALKAEDFEAEIDLGYKGKGTYTETVIVTKKVESAEVFQINPEDVVVRIEDKTTKTVSLESMIEGVPAENHIVGRIILDPEEAIASGPKSEIESLRTGTAKIVLDKEANSFEKEVELKAYNSKGKIVRSISFEPSKVKAKISIFSGTNNKAVGIKPKISGVPGAGFWVSEIRLDPATVVINSDSKSLENIDYIETSLIDINGIVQEKESEINLVFPEGIISVEDIQKVKVTVILSTFETTREIYASFGFVNLDSFRRVTRINPDELRVAISGPADVVRALTSSDISIEINLEGKGAGTYRIDVGKDNVKTPSEIGVISLLPNVVEVTLE